MKKVSSVTGRTSITPSRITIIVVSTNLQFISCLDSNQCIFLSFFLDGQDVSYFSIVSIVSIVNDVDIVIVVSIVSIVRNVSSVLLIVLPHFTRWVGSLFSNLAIVVSSWKTNLIFAVNTLKDGMTFLHRDEYICRFVSNSM